jgi:hypothetical protein
LEKYDLVIVLGSQVKKEGNQYILASHTELKAKAAELLGKKESQRDLLFLAAIISK